MGDCRSVIGGVYIVQTRVLARPVSPPYDVQAGANVIEFATAQPEGAVIRLKIEGPDYDDPDKTDISELQVNLGRAGPGTERLERSGLLVLMDNGVARLDEPLPATEFFPLATNMTFTRMLRLGLRSCCLPKIEWRKRFSTFRPLPSLGWCIGGRSNAARLNAWLRGFEQLKSAVKSD